MKRTFSPLQLSAVTLCAGILAAHGQTTDTWTGLGTDANWSTAGNWSAGAPATGNSLVFTGTGASVNNDLATNAYNFGGILFDVNAGAFTLGGNDIYTAGVIENDAVGTVQTIGQNLILTGPTTFNLSNFDITISGKIAGVGPVVVTGGNGTNYELTFTGAASYSGNTIISNATLYANNINGTYTMAGGALDLNYGSYYSGLNAPFTADSFVGNEAGRFDCDGAIGSPGFKWTKIGAGLFDTTHWQTNLTVVQASSIYVAQGKLGDVANNVANDTNDIAQWGGAGVPIEVAYGAALVKWDVGVIPNPITLDGGDGTGDGNGALYTAHLNGSNPAATILFQNSITLSNDATIGVQYGQMIVLGNVVGQGGLTKVGNNVLTLSGTNNYGYDGSGTVVNGGTLQLGSSYALPSGNTNGALNLNTAKLDLNGNNATINYMYDEEQNLSTIDNSSASPSVLSFYGSATFNGAVKNSGGGPLSLVYTGTSIAQFLGINTYSGSNVVQSGKMDINIPTGTTTGGLLAVGDTAEFSMHYRVAGSSLKAAGANLGGATGCTLDIDFGNFGSPAVVINATNGAGVLAANGVTTINLANVSGMGVGQFPLIKYLSRTGNGSFALGTVPSTITAVIVTNASGKSIDLSVLTAQVTKWTGSLTNNNWDVSLTKNWVYGASPVTYTDGIQVNFDDTAVTNNINVTTGVYPSGLLVNATKNYLFAGSGSLNNANLTKNGSGTLSVATANNFLSGTTISGGTVQLGTNGTTGDLGTANVDDEATLSFMRSDNLSFANTISGAGVVAQNNTNTVTITAANTYTGGTLVNQGVIKLGVTNALGAPATGTPLATVSSGAALDFAGNTPSVTNAIAISGTGNGVANQGALFSSAGWTYLGGTESGVNALILNADATIGDNSAWIAVGKNGVNGIQGNNHNLVKVGSDTLAMEGPASSALASITVANGGVLLYNHVNWFGSAATLIVSNNASVDSWDSASWTGITVPNNIVIGAGGGRILDDHGPYYGQADQDTYNGSVTLNGNMTINCSVYYSGAPANVLKLGKITFNGAISGTGAIYNTGATNPVVLNGANTYTGPTVVSAGNLLLSTIQQGGGVYTNKDGAVLDAPTQNGYATLPMATLALGSVNGSTLSLSRLTVYTTTNAPVTATNLVLTGTNVVLVSGLAFANPGDYPLIKYGTLTGSLANLTLGAPGARGLTGYLTNNVANSSIDLVVPGGTPVLWTGSVSTNWDLTTLNWATNGGATAYQPGDYVTFNDTAVTNVFLATNISSGWIIVNNTNSYYTFTGSNITGSTALLKAGTGTLLLTNGANTFTGGATIVGGTVKLGAAGSLNNSSGTVTVSGNGCLDFNYQSPTALAITISGTGFNGLGTVVANYTNAAAANGPASVTLAGSATIGGTNRWDIRNGANQLNSPSTNYTLTKVGAGYVGLVGTAVSTNLGDIVLLGGTFSYQTSTAGLGNTNNSVIIGSSGKLSFYQAAVPLNKNIICSNGATIATESGSGGQNTIIGNINILPSATLNLNFGSGVLNIASPLNIPSGTTVANNGNYYGTINYSNVISGSGNFNIQYQSYVNLAASNTFTGTITVPDCGAANGGLGTRLSLIGNGSVSKASQIVMQGITPSQAYAGFIDVNSRVDATLTLGTNQTLRGDNGSFIRGNVAAAAGSAISPGGISTNYQYMSISNSLTFQAGSTNFMDIYKSGALITNDLILVTGNLTNNGAVLQIGTNGALTALAAGDTFKLFNAAAYVGSFARITPSPGPGLIWDASQLAVNGTLSVKAISITPSPATVAYGNNATLTGSTTLGGTVGYQWYDNNTNAISGANGTTLTLTKPAVAASGNYTLVVTNAYTAGSAVAALTVTPAALSVTASNLTKPFGQTYTFLGTEFSASGLVTGDSVSSVTLTSTGAASGAAVGNYSIVPSAAVGTGVANYTITYNNGTLAVVQTLPATGTNMGVNLNGNQLTLSWPTNYIGWLLQSNSVNLVDTNKWFTVPGSAATNSVIITVDPTKPQVFYRMSHP